MQNLLFSLINTEKSLRHGAFFFDDTAVSSTATATSSSGTSWNSTTVILRQTPIIHGEALTAEDFVEFISNVALNSDLPPTLLRPPAVSRILASKACKRAIKFGDKLSMESCEALLQNLLATDLPFQCAHGRPSLVPLLQLGGRTDGKIKSKLNSKIYGPQNIPFSLTKGFSQPKNHFNRNSALHDENVSSSRLNYSNVFKYLPSLDRQDH